MIRATKIYNPEKEFLLRAREWPVRVKNTAWKTHGKANLATRCELELAAGVCVSNKELGLKHRTNQLLSLNLIMSRRIWAKKSATLHFAPAQAKSKARRHLWHWHWHKLQLWGDRKQSRVIRAVFCFFLCSEGVCGALSWACFCTDNNMPARWTYHRWVRVRPRLDIISERAGGSFVTCLKGDTWNPPCYLQIPPIKPQTAQHKQQHNRQQKKKDYSPHSWSTSPVLHCSLGFDVSNHAEREAKFTNTHKEKRK